MNMFFLATVLCTAMVQLLEASSITTNITSAGTYMFQDFTANPDLTDDIVINIQVSDVTLDFTGGAIRQADGNTVAGLVGIKIDNNLNNIVIKNVTIRDLTGKGIIVGEGCSDITLQNVTIEGCGTTGAEFAGTVSNKIKNVQIKDCIFRSIQYISSSIYGLRVIYGENIVIRNSHSFENDAQTNAFGFGMSFENCRLVLINDGNIYANGGSALGVGIQLSDTDWSVLKNITIFDTVARTVTTGKAIGLLLNSCENCLVRGVTVKHNINSSGIGMGINATAGKGNLFDSCIAKANEGDDLAAGIVLDGAENSTVVIHCKCTHNVAQSGGTAYGIYLDTAASCDVFDNYVMYNTSVTNGYGLQDTVTDTTNLILGNKAYGNTTSGFDVTFTGLKVLPLVSGVFGLLGLSTVSKYMNVNFE